MDAGRNPSQRRQSLQAIFGTDVGSSGRTRTYVYSPAAAAAADPSPAQTIKPDARNRRRTDMKSQDSRSPYLPHPEASFPRPSRTVAAGRRNWTLIGRRIYQGPVTVQHDDQPYVRCHTHSTQRVWFCQGRRLLHDGPQRSLRVVQSNPIQRGYHVSL